MKCLLEDCKKEAAEASIYCEDHKEFEKAGGEAHDEDGEGEGGGE